MIFLDHSSNEEITLRFKRLLENITDPETITVPDWTVDLHTERSPYTRKKLDFVKFEEVDIDVIRFTFTFRRIFVNNLLQVFFPSVMLCIGSCVSVFIPSDMVPGRMALCVTTFLSLIALFNGAR